MAHDEQPAETFEQAVDQSGRIRLDRKLRPDEAAAQDEANRRAFVEARAARFGAVPPAVDSIAPDDTAA